MEKEREPIAIVGIGCRFPGSSGPEGFWRTLCEGKDTIGPIPRNRWDAEAFYDADPTKRGKMVARTGGFLDDIEGFDWRAFRVSPREAKFMDPQHRLLLEVAWEAFEDAGVPFEKVAGSKTAVFVGIMWNDYGKLQALDLEGLDGYSASGNAFAFAANRISFFFDLKGPSVALDVSCASSLIAVHLACESIWSGESVMALAGGVNLIIAPDSVIAMSKAGILSAEGHCKPFDASADGFVRGEGGGVVVLKPLSAALADGDRIHAVIRGTAAMHSGKTDWIMAPSSGAQEEVYREAYRRAGIDPCDVDYVELHGTGTRKGDPLEAKSVSSVMGAGSGRQGRCVVGSVKTNLGHLDSAAGVAGLIKAALALEHRQIPGSLNLKSVNPEIDLDALGLDFRTELGPWPAKQGRAIAGVTGLSFGGHNVHVVLEEPPRSAEATPLADAPDSFVLPLSARSDGALRSLATEYQSLLAGELSLPELCAAACLNRTHHSQRTAVTGRTASELRDALVSFVTESANQSARGTAHNAPVFVFSGQGPQWWAMGRELARCEPVFRDVLERCDAAIRRHASFSLLEELGRDEATTRVQETQVAQPLLFALQAALARLLESWGVKPGAVVGHSVGEIAAAYVSGALSLETAARIAACRGRIMHAASHLGRMVAVNLSRDEAAALVEPFGERLGVAAENGPRSVVLSGETEAVQAALQLVKDRGGSAKLLPVRYAFHSAIMTRFEAELVRALEGVEPRDPAIPVVSTLLGRRPTSGEAFTPTYWAQQMREPVEFFKAISSLAREGHRTFVEIGPHPVLAAAIGECLGDARDGACIVPTLVRSEPERLSMLSTLAALYSRGQDVAWTAIAGKRAWAPLPTYPWQREKMWIERRAPARAFVPAAATPRSHPLLQMSSKLARPSGTCIWEAVLDVERMPYLRDHGVGGKTVVPASLFVEMAIAASVEETGARRLTLRDVELLRALVLPENDPVRVQLLSTVEEGGATRIEIWSRPESEPRATWTLHVKAVMDPPNGNALPSVLPPAQNGEAVPGAEVYAAFRRAGEDYGAAFQGIQRLWQKTPSTVLAELSAPRAIAAEIGDYYFHPALLDACMHCMAASKTHAGEGGFMPTRFDRIEVVGRGGARLWARASIRERDAESVASGSTRASIRVLDDRGALLLDIQGVSLQYLDELGARDASRSAVDTSSCYQVAWRPVNVPAASPDSPGRFVIVSEGGDLTTALGHTLEQDGHTVAVSTSFDGSGDPCRAVVFVADAPGAPQNEAAAPGAATSMRLIETARAMSALPSGTEPRLFVVTRGAQRVADERVEPSQGMLWGLGRSIAAEYPSLWGGLIDAALEDDLETAASAIAGVVRATAAEDQIAVRSGTCLAARLVRFVAPAAAAPLAIERDAAYLVTGGFGALGQTFARDLLERGAQHVILMSRSGPSAEHAAALGKLSGLGGAVYHAIADVADEAQVRSALDMLRRDGVPEVRGVLHAAGTVMLKPLADLDERDVESVFLAKVKGTWVLDRIFATSNLGFFVLFSSASSVLQSASLGAYAAANAYQDALAHSRRARGQHALTVNWGPWAGEGMAKDTGAGRGPLGLRGMGAIDDVQGTRLLGRFLELDLSQVSVLPIDWGTFRAAYPSFDRSPFLSELGAARASGEQDGDRKGGSVHSILQAGGGKITRERIEQYLLDSAARALHARPEALNADSTLIELGLDSLMLVELRLEIERALGVRLRLMDLLSDPTIRELSKNLEPHVKEVA